MAGYDPGAPAQGEDNRVALMRQYAAVTDELHEKQSMRAELARSLESLSEQRAKLRQLLLQALDEDQAESGMATPW